MADPRLTPARGDIAAKHLEGKVDAARFVDGETFEVIETIAPLRDRPTGDAMLLTQALAGERVTIYDRTNEGWAWGQLDGDGYVGWLPDASLATPSVAPTHQVTAIRTFAFPGPSIKLPPIDAPVMGSRLIIVREEGVFAVTPEGWYVPRRHLGALDHHEPDFVAVAERFVGTPYLWGGKSCLGVDCSGLVQLALQAASRRSRLLEGPCRDRAGCRDHHPCECASHGDGHREHHRRRRPHQGGRQRDRGDQADLNFKWRWRRCPWPRSGTLRRTARGYNRSSGS
jgi:cell wall-associated NlpC family hydrolase